MYREITDELIKWKDSKRRKPLLLKVGFKSSLKNMAANMVYETNTVSFPLYLLWHIDFSE